MSTPKKTRCKYPHRIGVRVDDELYVKIQNGAIMCDLSPSEFFRQMLKKRRLISWQKIAVVPPELPGGVLISTARSEMSSTIWLTTSTQEAHWMWTVATA